MKFFSTFVVAFFLSNASFAAENPPIKSFTLKNGLEVLVVENHRVPAVNHTIWYRVGAADDPLGKSGLAHYHEHAMFLGTARYKKGEYENIITSNGGEQNAFTGHDATAYFVNIAKDKLPLVMEMEADRLRGITPSDDDMLKEKQVILEERRMRIDNHPEALLAEQVDAALFRNHPYHIPVIGWLHEMEGLTKQDVIDFHNKWYHPNNAVLIVAGDVNPDEVKKLAEKYYGGFVRVAVPTRKWNAEPPQRAERRITMYDKQVSQPKWSRNYTASSLADGKKDEVIPLFILAQILGGGKTSRLYDTLITNKKIATSVSVGYNGIALGIAEFSIDAEPAENIDSTIVEGAVDEEIAKLIKDGITSDELSRAKTLLKAETIFARDGLSGMANIIGWVRMVGEDPSYFSKWSKLVDEVNADAVISAAKNTLKREQSVASLLLPEAQSKREEK